MPAQGTHKGRPYHTLHRLFRELILLMLRTSLIMAHGCDDKSVATDEVIYTGFLVLVPLTRCFFIHLGERDQHQIREDP